MGAENGLNVLTGGLVFIAWEMIGPAQCKVYWFLMQGGETLCSWLMATLSAERFVALYFPLRHRVLHHTRSTRLVLLGVLLFSLAATSPSIYFAEIVPIYGYENQHCSPSLTSGSWVLLALYVVTSIFGIYLFPVVVCGALTLCLTFKLLAVAKARAGLASAALWNMPDARRPALAECSAALTIVCLIAADFVICGPLTAFFSAYFAVQVGMHDSAHLQALLLTLTYLFYNLTLFKRLANLYVYLFRLPALRRRLFSDAFCLFSSP